MRPSWWARAFTSLYQELGNRTTDDLSITLLQGRSVGGGTTVNWCSCFHTPDRILQHWREVSGIDTLSPQVLAPHFEAVERRLNVATWPLEAINENNRVLWDGLGALGYERALIRRNVAWTASRRRGTPSRSVVTVLPEAVKGGLDLYSDTVARIVDWDGRRVTRVHAEVLDPSTRKPTGVKVVVRPKVTVLSGGAINTPGLLLRSGLDAAGRVGRRTWIHPVVMMLSQFDKEVRAFSGAPQSVSSHHFSERGPGKLGFFLEVPPIHPMLASIVASGSGRQLQDVAGDFPRLNALLAIHTDGLLPEEVGGTVRLRDGAYGRFSFEYELTETHWEAFRTACKEMARVAFAAGAKRVFSLHLDPVILERPEDIGRLDAAPWESLRVRVVSAHQMGGCAMGKEATRSVVDPHLRFHSLDNLFVVDGSVLPTGLGVNPQETIFAIARWAGEHIAQAMS